MDKMATLELLFCGIMSKGVFAVGFVHDAMMPKCTQKKLKGRSSSLPSVDARTRTLEDAKVLSGVILSFFLPIEDI